MSTSLYVGLDAGGSKTSLLARTDDERPPIRLTGPGANYQRMGLEATAGVLTDLVREALEAAPGSTLAAVCAGVAGAGRSDDQAKLTTAIRNLLGADAPDTIRVVSDGEIALEAAFEGGSGIIVIVGTGSLVLARTRKGGLHRAGGWGYLLGDEGGGLVIGREGLRHVAHALDGGPPMLLADLVAREFGITSGEILIRQVYRENWPVQHVAPLVIQAAEAGDAISRSILTEQTAALARQAGWVASGRDVAPRIVLFGGLAGVPYYRHALTSALNDALPGWSVDLAHHEPVYGALLMARRVSRSGAGAPS